MLSISCPLGESSKRFSTYSMRTKPGEVWLADLGIAVRLQLQTSRVWLPFLSLAFSVASAKSPAKCWHRSKRRFDLLSISRGAEVRRELKFRPRDSVENEGQVKCRAFNWR